jgi:threonine synthase
VPVEEGIYSLELFHGPTLAFKDVGARFMSRCLSYFIQSSDKKITVLVATSGDTGSAVANGFYNVEGVDVVLLYPSGKVSNVQELQLTTYGGNITAIEIDGSFDDCQRLVKQAFADEQLRKRLLLTSANSINVARWLPQQFYYFFACRQWPHKDVAPVISVPSGNFGNICAGMLAACSGLPVQHFIAVCNENDVVSAYLKDGIYSPKPSVQTISNAMDVGNPSNFVRIIELYEHDLKKLKSKLSSYTISDEETKTAIRDVYKKTGYLLDPHGAVGYCGLKRNSIAHPDQQGFFLETAHPVKFSNVVEPVINEQVKVPPSISNLYFKEKKVFKMNNDYNLFKEF